MTNIDLVLEDDRVRAVDHQIVSIFSHDAKERLHDDNFFFDTQVLALILTVSFFDNRSRLGAASSHVVQVPQLDVPVESVLSWASDRRGESNMDELGGKLQVHHFGWQVLAASIVQGNTSVLTACDKKITVR